jgi:peptide/nickel transport system permease protein
MSFPILKLLRRIARLPTGAIGLVLLATIFLIALFAPWLYPGDPWKMVGRPNLPPFSPGFLLGTDMLGRDIAAGIAHGARVSLLIGFVATMVAVTVGSLLGAIAGYHGGRIDDLIMRVTEIFQTIPSFLLALLLVAIFSPSIYSIVLAIGIVSWPSVARLVRAEFLTLRTADFVKAAIVGGQNWWLSAIPGIAIFLTVLALNFVGDGLNHALNPRSRGSNGNT